MEQIKYKFVNQNLTANEREILKPAQKSAWASGFDLSCASVESICIGPNERVLVPTGIAICLNPGFEAQVRSRSGLALKNGVIVLNAPGTIDADYRGEIKVILANLSTDVFVVEYGMRIAQLVIAPVCAPQMVESGTIEETMRGADGFGSTGI